MYWMYILAQDQNGLVRPKTQGLCFSCAWVSPELLPLTLLGVSRPSGVSWVWMRLRWEPRLWRWRTGAVGTAFNLQAIWLSTLSEALSEAGRAVARSWQVARQSSEQGVAGLVRGLFAVEKKGQEVPSPRLRPRLRPVAALPSLAVAPVPGKKRGYVNKDEQPMVLDEGATQQFMEMLLTVGQHRADDARARTNFKAIIREVLTKSEPATVKRGLQTWRELRGRWCIRLLWSWMLIFWPSLQGSPQRPAGCTMPWSGWDETSQLAWILRCWCLQLSKWAVVMEGVGKPFGVVRFGHLQRSNWPFGMSQWWFSFAKRASRWEPERASFGQSQDGGWVGTTVCKRRPRGPIWLQPSLASITVLLTWSKDVLWTCKVFLVLWGSICSHSSRI